MPAQRANAKQKTGCCETEPRKQPTAAAVEELAKLAWGIAHPARVRIVHLLASREACVCGEIVDELPLAQSTVSQHLKILKDSGLVQGEVSGPRVCYCVNRTKLEKLKTLIGNL